MAAFVTFPFWLYGTRQVEKVVYGSDPVQTKPLLNSSSKRPISRGLWLLTIIGLLIWIPLISEPQVEQQNRNKVEELFQQKKIAVAVEMMTELGEQEFPPHWDPPPILKRRRGPNQLPEVMDVLLLNESQDWVFDRYYAKLLRYYGTGHHFWTPEYGFNKLELDQLKRFVLFLESHPEERRILAYGVMQEIYRIARTEKIDFVPESDFPEWVGLINRIMKLAHDFDENTPSSLDQINWFDTSKFDLDESTPEDSEIPIE